MSENSFWRTLATNMARCKGWREATRHEDKLQLGIADLSFVSKNGLHGWMELKKVHEWPKRDSTIVRIPHYTDHQRIWLKKKGEAGGNVWLLVKISRDVLLFDWKVAQHVGHMYRGELMSRAAGVWLGKMDYDALGTILSDGKN